MYTIGQLSHQIGIGREALRHYENIGLLLPKRDDENGYRYYDDLDALSVLHTKLLQSYGLPLAQILSNMNTWPLSKQEEYLEQYEAYLDIELKALKSRRDRIRRMRGFLQDAETNLGTFWESDLKGLYKLIVLGKGADPSPENVELIRDWQEKFPITDIGWHIFREDIQKAGVIPISISLTVLDEYVQPLHYDVDPPVFHFPAGHSVRTILCIDDPFHLTYEHIAPFLIYLEEKGYTLISDLTGRYSGCDFEDGKAKYYFTLRGIVNA